ncbi:unnamed protein product [Urochloa decumbens]|uniref:Uncharacterized protein n=1 Tax=Urochloa decumbens TaxID=240449 RepID=A0ABC9C5N8_9POAL
MAKTMQMVFALMILCLLYTTQKAEGAMETSKIKKHIHVETLKSMFQLAYLPETNTYHRCYVCECCENGKCSPSTCCNEFVCDAPGKPPSTCTIKILSCGCTVESCH